ncbi:MAG: succinate dehydrogenase, cytochrome b556 subunit [Gammaproteobacteria bacterium]|nr:succinate dehydrogenase, cytochrome b556 subunit [Gammaproteobacteria bacterium]
MTAPRPLSPHLQVYRFLLPMAMSITHRATGVFLGLGSLLLVCWLTAAAAGPEPYAQVAAIIGSLPGMLALIAWTVALYYHLCNGIRHLFWDVGKGFAIADAYRSGYLVLGATAFLTILTWVVILSGGTA